MGLFDIFTFKGEAVKIFSKENIIKTLETAKNAIIEQVQNNIPGPEKKEIVDKIVIEFIRSRVASCTNKVVLWFVDRLIDIIPSITQLIYDFLKAKIENL